MSKAQFLGEAISFFNPMLSLDQTRADWYVEREDEPLERMKIHLLNDRTDTKVLFSGHRGSGKSSLLDKLARDPEIEAKFLVVKFSVKEALNVADLAYTDLLIAMGQRLFEVAEEQAVLSRSLLENLDRWSAKRTVTRKRGRAADAIVKAGIKAWFAEATGTLRTGIEEKQELRQTFEPKIPQLIESINRIIQAVETKKKGSQREVLIIVDDR